MATIQSAVRKTWDRPLGLVFFWIGVLLGLALAAFTTWAGLEADFYFGFGVPADAGLSSLNCPWMITKPETGVVSMSINNTTTRTIEPSVDVTISNEGMMRQISLNPSIAAGQKQRLDWNVTTGDMVFGHLILVEVYQYAISTLPSRHGTCGILVLGLPGLPGDLLYILTMAISLICIAAGGWIWFANNRPLEKRVLDITRAMIFLAAIVLAAMVAGTLGIWGVSLVCVLLAVLLIATVAAYLMQQSA